MLEDLVLDPAKRYAEMRVGTNIVARIFNGETIPGWARPGRLIVVLQDGSTVNVGDRYQPGVPFDQVPPPLTLDQRASLTMDGQRFLFEVNFDQENRVRALEGKAPITRVAYRDAWTNLWKTLNL